MKGEKGDHGRAGEHVSFFDQLCCWMKALFNVVQIKVNLDNKFNIQYTYYFPRDWSMFSSYSAG